VENTVLLLRILRQSPFPGSSAKLWKGSISFVVSVCPSVSMEQFGSQWMDFHEIWYLNIFRKSAEKIKVSLKSDKNSGYFTWIRTHIYDNISLNSVKMQNISDKSCRANQNTYFIFHNFSRKLCRLWGKVQKYGTARQAAYALFMLDA